MTTALTKHEPALVWRHFESLTRIPRPPKGEERARQLVLDWAAGLGLEADVDDAGNVVVRVPATPGRESAAAIVLQAHLDMVCEREPTSTFDPRTGPVDVAVEGDWVVGVSTTLGADNGIGVATALAAAEDPALQHGPLELLLTVSEEEGLEGAKALDPALVSGRLLVNLDGTNEAGITIGCAGSAHTFTRLAVPVADDAAGWSALSVLVTGGRGGHSGSDIHLGRANAIVELGRVLAAAHEESPLRLRSLAGGASRNAIPREAYAEVVVPSEAETALRDAIGRARDAVRTRFADSDPEVDVVVQPARPGAGANEAATARALELFSSHPNGVVSTSTASRDVVETSTSLNVASTEDGVLTLAAMTRSSSAAGLEQVLERIEDAARRAGADVDVRRSYPPWEPDLESHLLRVARETYARLFDVEPWLDVVHGGLECAVIGGKLPGVEMISIGPRIVGPHAPGERLAISSTQRFYRLLGALLDELS